MKALSIKQPWANMIADGKKGIEVRTWGAKYEGPIYIHTGKSADSRALKLFRGVSTQPRGVILATAEISMIVHYTKQQFYNDRDIHLMPRTWWSEGLFGWLLVNVKRLENPIPYRGQLGLFEVKL